jgi:carbonic anhydrase
MIRRRLAVLVLPLLLGAASAEAGVCETGRRQSPIDIVATERATLPALDFAYRAAPLKVANDGHTVRVRFDRGGELGIGAQRYRLEEFHFHTPGGDRIAGESFPMAAHLLHRGTSGQLLAVVVLFRTGAENPLLATLLPLVPPRADGNHVHGNVMVTAGDLLPAGRGYYRYAGSLTAPPCTENVDWIILREPIDASAAQLAHYRRRFADNARAVQATNDRVVLESR